ncbi:aprataxin [Rhynchophorus ferrugineus]|uniref:aprataxin n=1 Tax=Rhynchophorus ferrugineus TaxID=354439 RepID=UPI003FCE5ECF
MRRRLDKTKDDHEPKAKKGHWASGLLTTMKDKTYILEKDDLVTMIKDMYPKAKYHYLVLPNENISNLKALNASKVPLLEHMHNIGKKYIQKNHSNITFKMGYHAEASMHRLHLHIISVDMNSPCLKTKKHWNSFTTDFFLDSNEIIENLRKNGKVLLPSKQLCETYMKSALKCHKCHDTARNMPELKKHILTHLEDDRLSVR